MTTPFQSDGNGHANRDATGRFLPGHGLPGPGRPRRPALHEIAQASADAEGYDLAAALWTATKKLLDLAQAGDVQAARLVIDRLTDPDAIQLHHVGDAAAFTGPPIPDTRTLAEELAIASRLIDEVMGQTQPKAPGR